MREAETHRLIAGDPCLDFANTLNGHARLTRHEYLHSFEDLALWSRHAGLLGRHESSAILRRAATRPTQARIVFRHALELRELIFRIFRALAAGERPEPDDLRRLSAAWRAGQRHARVVLSKQGFAIAWDDKALLEKIPRTLCASAISLLTSDKARLIRSCAGDGCDWLFVDGSRNHLRRWCSMEECGNRAKMRRRQQRRHLASA